MEHKNHPKLEELKVNGELLSPTLPEGVKNYLIDIDGTIWLVLSTIPMHLAL
jgi:hypothetical protein